MTDPPVDLMVLDVMLPGLNGFQVATTLRAQGSYVPILMLTARGRADDVVKGFEAGADDYLPKPFDLTVLIARIGALLRRHAWGHRQQGGARPVGACRTAMTSPDARLILQPWNCGEMGERCR